MTKDQNIFFLAVILSIILKTYSLDKELKLLGEIDVGHFWDLEDKGDTHENFTGVCLIQVCFTKNKLWEKTVKTKWAICLLDTHSTVTVTVKPR